MLFILLKLIGASSGDCSWRTEEYSEISANEKKDPRENRWEVRSKKKKKGKKNIDPAEHDKKQKKICIDTHLKLRKISADRREEEKTERRENSPENRVRNDTADKKCHFKMKKLKKVWSICVTR